jgi:hypothetical protein
MIDNASFESDSDNNKIADGWSTTGMFTPTLSTDAKEGLRSQQIQSNGYGNGVYQCARVLPSSTYTLSAWVKVQQGQACLEIDEADNAYNRTRALRINKFGTTGWTYQSFTLRTEPNTTRLYLYFTSWVDGITVASIDDLCLKPSIIQNSSFEAWSATNSPQNWLVEKNGIATPCNDAKDGVYSMKIADNRNTFQGVQQYWINVKPATSYRLSAWVKVEKGHLEIMDQEVNRDWSRNVRNLYEKIGVSS